VPNGAPRCDVDGRNLPAEEVERPKAFTARTDDDDRPAPTRREVIGKNVPAGTIDTPDPATGCNQQAGVR
jgi:hypothetical protein